MKLILSRKGFDSSAGGVPSPIFPDGRMVSLPIPDADSVVAYQEIAHGDDSLGTIVSDLTRGRLKPSDRAHIDPDLIRKSLPRRRGWRPVFGQSGAAQSHLHNHGVGPGDLFIFFGLFRDVVQLNGKWTWARSSRSRHVIWGWFRVGEVLRLEQRPSGYRWAQYHPHFHQENRPNNTAYLARRYLQAEPGPERFPGAGVFTRFSPSLQLTAPDATTASSWRLPSCFHPRKNHEPLSYHGDLQRWRKRRHWVELRAAARGQEFVLSGEDYPEACHWALDLIRALGYSQTTD